MLLDGQSFPSLDVSLVPADPETTCSDNLDFNWELTDVSEEGELTIHLVFDTPVCVSGASSQQDELKIVFYD